jgi:hypothetical protein
MQPVMAYATPPAKVSNIQAQRYELTRSRGRYVTQKHSNEYDADGRTESLMRRMVMQVRERQLRAAATNEK